MNLSDDLKRKLNDLSPERRKVVTEAISRSLAGHLLQKYPREEVLKRVKARQAKPDPIST